MLHILTKKQLSDIMTEAIKIYLNEEDDAYLYGARPEGSIPMEIEKNLEGADIQINSAGTLHIERCEARGDIFKLYDTEGRELDFSKDDIEKLLDGDSVNAVLHGYGSDTPYDVFISIAHASGNQRIMRHMRDLQRGGRPIFNGSEII